MTSDSGISEQQSSGGENHEAAMFGGSDKEEWQSYKTPTGNHYSDKGGHKQRSLANDPKHKKHWQKQTRRNQDFNA